jgi:hypothetical protein
MNDNPPPAFEDWLATARPGEQFIYFTGFLADRIRPPSPQEKSEGLAALEAYSRGEVELAQRRIKPSTGGRPGVFEYVAVKRKHKQVPMVLGSPWKTRIKGPETAR